MRIYDVRGIHYSLSDLQKLSSLRSLNVRRCESMFSAELDDNAALHSVQDLSLTFTPVEVFSNMLKCFPALSKLSIRNCKSLDLLPVENGGAHIIKPFAPSIRKLIIVGGSSIKSMALLSNLTSLTHLWLRDCEELTMDGFNPLMTFNLKELQVCNMSLDKQNRRSQ